jgi:predicted transcriptional regulator of viral defense system
MRRIDLFKRLEELERRNVLVLSKKDMGKLFPEEDEKAMEKSLKRMVREGLLVRAARGVYVNASAASRNASRIIEDVAIALRPGKFSYVSLESALSEYGVISQIPMSRLTVMTTGASGVHETPYGVIEFTHTKRSPPEVLARTVFTRDRPLRVAKKQTAVQDLRRVGRNTDLIDLEALEDEAP